MKDYSKTIEEHLKLIDTELKDLVDSKAKLKAHLEQTENKITEINIRIKFLQGSKYALDTLKKT